VGGIIVNSSGEIFVADIDTNEIVGFAPGSSGNVSPNVVIAGTNTNLAWPVGLALDTAGDLYVANCGSSCESSYGPPSVLEFSAGSNGNVSPIRDVSGSNTELSNANSPALDASGNIYVSNWTANTIDVFNSDANGNASPVRVISGANTLLNNPDGIAVYKHWLYAGSAYDHYLERFHLNASGNASPVAVIQGGRTHLDDVDGIWVTNGVIFASSPGNNRILKFAALGNGDIRPKGQIIGSKTELNQPVWVYAK
jgi:hypothetical protein